jgi:peptidoglycan/LPS O-acetylase OafA/YrhL
MRIMHKNLPTDSGCQNHETSVGNPKNQYIQLLRGLAVVSVLVYHATPGYYQAGYLGVDIFFIISGYLVVPKVFRISQEPSLPVKLIQLRKYFRSRFLRIFPPLASLITLYSLPILFLGNVEDFFENMRQMCFSIFGLGNIGAYLYSGNYFSSYPNPFVHTWSLALEIQFYFILPIVFILANLVTRRHYEFPLLILLSCFSLFFFLVPESLAAFYSLFGISDHETFQYYDFTPRIWEFTLGGILGISSQFREFLRSISSRIPTLVWPATLILSMIFLSIMNFSMEVEVFTIALATLFSLNCSLVNPTAVNEFPRVRRIGDISYSLYLVHMPNLYLFKVLSDHIHVSNELAVGMGLLTSYPIAVGLHAFAENAKLGKNSRINPGIKKGTYQLFLALASLMVLNIIFYRTDVITSRLDKVESYAGWVDPKCERDSFNGPPCSYGSAKRGSVLLIGDSRAGMISSSVIDVAGNLGMRSIIWAHSGCRYLPDSSSNNSSNCLQNSLDTREYIKKNRPEIVMFSQSLVRDESEQALINAINEVREFGIYVLVVTPIPIVGDKNFGKIGSLLIPNTETRSKVSFKELDKATMNSRANFLELLNLYKIPQVDPFDVLCKSEFCIVQSNGSQVYRDNNHLSISGSKILEPEIKKQLKIGLKVFSN